MTEFAREVKLFDLMFDFAPEAERMQRYAGSRRKGYSSFPEASRPRQRAIAALNASLTMDWASDSICSRCFWSRKLSA